MSEKPHVQKTVLLRCPFCGANPITRQTKARTDQLHGELIQDWMIVCPHGHAQLRGASLGLAAEGWNERS